MRQTYNWYQACGTYDATYNPTSQNVCGSLNLGGYSDWRLPTKKELMSIVDYSIPYPGPTINTTYFPNTNSVLLLVVYYLRLQSEHRVGRELRRWPRRLRQ